MNAPRKSDYDVEVIEASVHVTFKPTDSHYTYLRLADLADVAREGPLSREKRSENQTKPSRNSSVIGRLGVCEHAALGYQG